MNETTEYYIEKISDFNFQMGRIAGINEIYILTKTRSGECFSSGRDDLAIFLRNFAEEIESKSKIKEMAMEKERTREKISEYWQLMERAIQNESYPSEIE